MLLIRFLLLLFKLFYQIWMFTYLPSRSQFKFFPPRWKNVQIFFHPIQIFHSFQKYIFNSLFFFRSSFLIFIFFLQIFILDIRHLFPIDIHCFNFPSFPQIYNLVKNYISTKETIIMVVVACNMEIATTKALKMANEVDPDGIRTLGIVLSNPFVPCNNRISLKLNNSR